MTSILKSAIILAVFSIIAACLGCGVEPANPENANSAATSNRNEAAPPAGSETARKVEGDWAVTLPVLDAFFADATFASDLKSNLQLTDQQIGRLREISHNATSELRESDRANAEDYRSATEIREKAESEVGEVIGREKVPQLFAFVAERWSGNYETAGDDAQLPLPSAPWSAPADTRIVVNAPAFRMDVFENGRLIKSYKIGIGYPEFPLPTGMREADEIIFNPTWTPPDEPWVQSSRSVEVGKTVKAGDRRNPLGRLKIPIGLPSLIHGGKRPAQMGNFASHGCIGLTDPLAIDFAKLLARLGGAELTDDQIAEYGKNRTETRTVKLNNPIPVELRYETISIEDGRLHMFRDVYDRDTNTEQNLQAALAAYGVTIEELNEQELAQTLEGLKQMSRDASGRTTAPGQANSNRNSSGRVTRTIKGEKEVAVEVAALKGKGYPAPADLGTGDSAKSQKPSKSRSRARR